MIGRAPGEKPRAVLARTVKGKGVSFMEDGVEWHHKVPSPEQVQQALEKIGYRVDVVEDVEEGARLLEQGVYELAATARETAPAGRPPTLAQRILRLTPDARRRVFVVLPSPAPFRPQVGDMVGN